MNIEFFNQKTSNEIDILIAQRIRSIRKSQKLSQEKQNVLELQNQRVIKET